MLYKSFPRGLLDEADSDSYHTLKGDMFESFIHCVELYRI